MTCDHEASFFTVSLNDTIIIGPAASIRACSKCNCLYVKREGTVTE